MTQPTLDTTTLRNLIRRMHKDSQELQAANRHDPSYCTGWRGATNTYAIELMRLIVNAEDCACAQCAMAAPWKCAEHSGDATIVNTILDSDDSEALAQLDRALNTILDSDDDEDIACICGECASCENRLRAADSFSGAHQDPER